MTAALGPLACPLYILYMSASLFLFLKVIIYFFFSLLSIKVYCNRSFCVRTRQILTSSMQKSRKWIQKSSKLIQKSRKWIQKSSKLKHDKSSNSVQNQSLEFSNKSGYIYFLSKNNTKSFCRTLLSVLWRLIFFINDSCKKAYLIT